MTLPIQNESSSGRSCSTCGAEMGKGSAKGQCARCYMKAYKATYYAKPENRERRRVRSAEYHQENKAARIAKMKANYAALKAEVMEKLGGSCQCCGEARKPFLTIDHIHGGGREHYRRMNGSHKRILYDIRRQGCPRDTYRVLCWNCNAALGLYGACPHTSS